MMETSFHPVGVIGGSADIDGLANPVGDGESPSTFDDLFIGELDGQMVFLPRHGRGHAIAPSDIDYRANIDALKRAGVTEIVRYPPSAH